jgi:succinate dehydrogenase / fumarate reductase cytochrome b subunit
LSTLVLTLRETLRYRGAIGQWSWALHRISGLGVVLFLILHVIDTSWSVFFPKMYEEAIATYQSPLFTIGEFALVACVVFHAYNGLRIILFDYKPEWWRHQAQAAYTVFGLTILTLIPVFALMFSHVLDFYDGDHQVLPIVDVIIAQRIFVIGFVVAIIAALVFSGVAGLLGTNEYAPGSGHPSQVERFWWSYMRVSGVLIVPLVFGHLALMHIVQGVFDLTAAEQSVVGTGAVNASGTAVEFVQARWSLLGWRLYDVALLTLVVIHGLNGLRYVLTDYTMESPLLRRASIYLTILGAVFLLLLGGGALLGSIDSEAVELAREARIELGINRDLEGTEEDAAGELEATPEPTEEASLPALQMG